MAKQEIHLSDGKKAVCGVKGQKAVTEEEKVTCPKCQQFLEKQAEEKKDPLIWCRVYNRNLADGTDFGFTFEGKLYHLVSGGETRIPRSVITHLRSLHYPRVQYQQGETGGPVKVSGSRHNFVVNELSEDEVKKIA